MIDRAALLDWYAGNKRALPWRETTDPYAIWVSEVMLQQTQVATVLPYYDRWMSRFPTVESLASACEQDVLSSWQGLGYYRRCRMLLAGSRWVALHGIPQTASDWMKVPGVGRYTASAISSISLGEPVPVVDGNVERVFARLAGCTLAGNALHRAAWTWAEAHVPTDNPGDWNQALMELGAKVCRPREPQCGLCPIAADCRGFQSGRQRELPVASKKPDQIALKREAWVHRWDGQFGLEQIPEGEWWEGMWRFPTESNGCESLVIGVVKHVVTRHRITMTAHLVDCAEPIPALKWFSLGDLKSLPMPAPQRRALRLAIESGGS